ncbi:MAG TPA: hypothetical protein DCQ92_05375 [Verrucomicrobia subdivision 3 bacterium]|nr:hypothetical protein [Limisphaerales bacterium]
MNRRRSDASRGPCDFQISRSVWTAVASAPLWTRAGRPNKIQSNFVNQFVWKQKPPRCPQRAQLDPAIGAPAGSRLWTWPGSARSDEPRTSKSGGQPALRFYGVARSLKNKILFVDNFRVKQLNRLVPPGNLWL